MPICWQLMRWRLRQKSLRISKCENDVLGFFVDGRPKSAFKKELLDARNFCRGGC